MRHFQKRAGRLTRSMRYRECEINPSANSRCDPPKKGSKNRNFNWVVNIQFQLRGLTRSPATRWVTNQNVPAGFPGC